MRENFYFIVIYIQTYVYGNLLYFLQLMCMTYCFTTYVYDILCL